ncbi:MAG: WD40 repeat domain-containing protein [Candidatus Methylacidiphilales bacterium]|nr:WD40 repeat domain-containing protein [Candidatus Methylacidiphilales bacterium]
MDTPQQSSASPAQALQARFWFRLIRVACAAVVVLAIAVSVGMWMFTARNYVIWADEALDIAWSPDGNHVAAACKTGMIHVVEIEPGSRFIKSSRLIQPLEMSGNQGPFMLSGIQWSPNGKLLANQRNHNITVVDAQSGRHKHLLVHPDDQATFIMLWSPDSKFLAVSGLGDTRIWSMDSGKELRYLEHPMDAYETALEFCWSHGKNAEGMYESGWRPDCHWTGVRLTTMKRDIEGLVTTWNPDGSLLAILGASSEGPSDLMEGTIWSLDPNRIKATLQVPASFEGPAYTRFSTHSVQWSADSRSAAACFSLQEAGSSSIARVWWDVARSKMTVQDRLQSVPEEYRAPFFDYKLYTDGSHHRFSPDLERSALVQNFFIGPVSQPDSDGLTQFWKWCILRVFTKPKPAP